MPVAGMPPGVTVLMVLTVEEVAAAGEGRREVVARGETLAREEMRGGATEAGLEAGSAVAAVVQGGLRADMVVTVVVEEERGRVVEEKAAEGVRGRVAEEKEVEGVRVRVEEVMAVKGAAVEGKGKVAVAAEEVWAVAV